MKNSATQKRFRFGFRTSLRSLFAVTLVCSLGSIWVGQTAVEYRREQAILADLNDQVPFRLEKPDPSVAPR